MAQRELTLPVPDAGTIGHAVADGVVIMQATDWDLVRYAVGIAKSSKDLSETQRKRLKALTVFSLAYAEDES